MRASSLFLIFAALTVPVAGDPIKATDRELLLEKLDELQSQAETRVDARFRLAVAAFREAMTSDEKAEDLYMKCLEKVEFVDEKRKSQDFRDFRRRRAEEAKQGRFDPAGFRRALRHQLRWLALTLEADSSNANRQTLIPRAQKIVADLFADAKQLEGQENVLRTPVTATVFAQAYDIGKVQVQDWPLSPVDLEGIYDQVLLPPHRNPAGLAQLRAGWLKRIEQEGAIREHWARYARRIERERARQEQRYEVRHDGTGSQVNETKIGMKENMRPPEFLKFLEEEVPELQWQMEVDLFKAGDQAGASMRLLSHIEKHLTHASVREWTDELRSLLKSTEAAPARPPAEGSATARAEN